MGFFTQQEPTEVVVARMTTAEGPAILVEGPRAVDVRVGQPLRIKLLFRIEDLPEFEEHLTLRFSSHTGGAGPEPAVLRHTDKPLINDTEWGYLPQRHVFQEPGTHAVRFKIDVAQTLQKWNDAGYDEHRHVHAEGALEVRVHA